MGSCLKSILSFIVLFLDSESCSEPPEEEEDEDISDFSEDSEGWRLCHNII